MTSRTSSDSSQRGNFRFPPRSELPPEVTIEWLPIVGTSWYERGIVYWARRAGSVIIFALVAVAYLAMIEGALQVISPPGTALYYGLAAGEIVFTAVTAVLIFQRAWRNSLKGIGATKRDVRSAQKGAASIGPLALAAGGPLVGLLVFLSLISAGLVLASFAIWMVPVPPMEQYQRRYIAERLRVHHGLEQLSPQSKHYGSKNHRKRRTR